MCIHSLTQYLTYEYGSDSNCVLGQGSTHSWPGFFFFSQFTDYLGLHQVMLVCVAQGNECLQVAPCEAVALLVAWQCAEEAATVEDLLAEGEHCPEEQHEEE